MAENSKIEWTDHTFNPWKGCQNVSPACDNCYAEAWAGRFEQVEWGPKAERKQTSIAYWGAPFRWEKRAKAEGKVLGNPNLQIDNSVRFENAKRFAEEKRLIIEALIAKGLTQRAIVDELNTQGITARRGGHWTLSQLQRVMKKLSPKTKGAK